MERSGARLPDREPATPNRFHVVSRYAEAAAVLKNAAVFSSALGLVSADGTAPLLSELDRPEHERIRRPMLTALNRRIVDRTAPTITAACRAIVDRLPAPSRVDLVSEAVVPALHHAIAVLVGVPGGEYERVFGWAAELSSHPFPGNGASDDARTQLDTYLLDLVRRTEPDGDTAVSAFKAAGRNEHPSLADSEIVVQMRSLIMSGYGATIDLLSILLYQLIVTPMLWRAVRADPALLDPVLEETLRFEAPATLLNRRCRADTMLGSERLHAGDVTLVAVGLANRDPAIHHDPDRFDPTRPRPELHLSFGAGPHTCPGVPLVRLLVKALVLPFLTRFDQPPMLTPGFQYRRAELFISRGPQHLDVDLQAAS